MSVIKFDFNAEFIERTKSKPWNWKKVSRHKSFVPTIELLSLTKDFDLDTVYYVLADSGSVVGLCDSWGGITSNTALTFKTDPGPSGPVSPATGNTSTFSLSFDRPIQPGTGQIIVRTSTGTVVATVASTSSLVTYS
jgi:hypothetical protein